MKLITLAISTVFCALNPLAADEEKREQLPAASEQAIVAGPKMGKEAIGQIREGYEQGKYDPFLKEIDASYQKMNEENKLSPLASFRTGMGDESEWTKKSKQLVGERNKELVASVADQETPFATQVRSAAADLSTSEEEAAINRLASFRHMAPGSGKNSDENALIALDLEYEYKAIHLDMPVVQGDPISDKQEKQVVLKMEKMDKMLSLAQRFQDADLKKAVEIAAPKVDARLAQNWDQSALNDLVKGKAKPADAAQEKVVAILQIYQEKMGDMTKEYLETAGTAHEANN